LNLKKKGLYILQGKVEKAIKEMRNRKATGDDDVPGYVLKLLGEVCLKIFTKLINTKYRVSQELRSLLRGLIPELILSQRRHVHMGQIRSSSGVMSF